MVLNRYVRVTADGKIVVGCPGCGLEVPGILDRRVVLRSRRLRQRLGDVPPSDSSLSSPESESASHMPENATVND